MSATNTSPGTSTTSSTKSHKSKQEVELESKISQLELLVGSQMEVIDNLQKAMDALNAKLDNNGSDTTIITNSYRKNAKTGQSPKNNRTRHDLSSNSELDHKMENPPDPQEDNHHFITTHTKEAITSTDADASNSMVAFLVTISAKPC